MNKVQNTSRPGIAVVGVNALLPGTPGQHGFWRDILAGKDSITEVPASHWLIDDYYDPDPAAPDKTYCKKGGFLDPVKFDSLAFGVPPNALPSTDTVQLLALMVARQVLSEACDTQFQEIDKSRTSVILGVASATELVAHMASRLQRPNWVKALREDGLPESQVQRIADAISDTYVPWQESSFPGLLGNVVAGRIANRLDLGGTNCVTDAACASSLSALQMGLNELYLGQSDLVIAGGVDALNDILMYMCFSKTPAFSPTGDCRPFSDNADGTILGEGLAMVALRRLEDAERDGNHIYAVIRGLGSSSDGQATSVYAPKPDGQAMALRRAYEAADYGPETVELVEGHGTGTVAGDAAEFAGLRSVFEPAGSGHRQWCALGSIKSQIGHTKAAAGAAGLFKVVMALHNKILPPTAKVDRPNPKMNIEDSPFYLSTSARPWIRAHDHLRRASVSSFGFGGSNFHVTAEEYTGENSRLAKIRAMPAELFLLSADDQNALVSSARQLAKNLHGDLARNTAEAAREFDSKKTTRLAIVAASIADLALKLTEFADDPETSKKGTYVGSGKPMESDIAFVFPGQGSQYVGMGADLAMAFDCARKTWDSAAGLTEFSGDRLHDVVFPPPAFDAETRDHQQARLTEMINAQPAIGAVSLSQLTVLKSLGLKPSALAGHSFGEVTALYAAGVFSSTEMLKVARWRGRLMTEAAGDTEGAMIALPLGREQAMERLSDLGLDIGIANDNSPAQVVLSGSKEVIDEAVRLLDAEGITSIRLPVATAFHSSIVADSVEPFEETLCDFEFCSPDVPVFGCADACAYTKTASASRKRLATQIAEPVHFRDQVDALYESGARLFVEVGPGSTLSRLVGQCLQDRPHQAISLDRKGANGVETLLHAIAQFSVLGLDLDYGWLWRDAPPDPIEQDAPAHAIEICGSNYGKPYPPPGGASDLPPPNPEISEAVPSMIHGSSVEPARTTSNETMIEAFHSQLSETHAAFQKSMAESHQAFLGMTERLLSGQPEQGAYDSADNTPGFQPMTRPPVGPQAVVPPLAGSPEHAPVPAMAPPPALPLSLAPAQASPSQTKQQNPTVSISELVIELVAEKTGYPAEMLNLEMELEADLGIDSIKQVEILSGLREKIPDLDELDPSRLSEMRTLGQIVAFAEAEIGNSDLSQSPASSISSAPANVISANVSELVIELVAEKTGYPAEMLNLDMELEADLGIDSIKQVEILSGLREKMPDLDELDPSQLTDLRTLGQIVAFANTEIGEAETSLASPSAETNSSNNANDLGDILISIVAEKTGYPAEMLNLDMELEADLGIDSIKQVEILSAVREVLPDLPEIDPSQLADLRTLGAILSAMTEDSRKEPVMASQEAPDIDAQANAPEVNGDVSRFNINIAPAASTGFTLTGLRDIGRIGVTDDGGGVSQTLVKVLGENGVVAEVVTQPRNTLAGLIHLGGLAPKVGPESGADIIVDAITWASSIAPRLKGRGGIFVTVQDTGGDFSLKTDPGARAWLGGYPALVKTAAAEWSDAGVKAIDIDARNRTADQTAEAIAEELFSGGPEIEVGLSLAYGRQVPTIVETPHVPQNAETPGALRNDMVIVASAGARGVTAAALIELCRHHRLKLALLGRTVCSENPDIFPGAKNEASLIRELATLSATANQKVAPNELAKEARNILANRQIGSTLSAIEEQGSEVQYFSVDICDREELATALEQVRKKWGAITGLVHGAGVLADRNLEDKTPDQVTLVAETKVGGLANLLNLVSSDPLEMICLFSSAAAVAGNPGQADYAMANEVLNKVAVAEAKRRPDCIVKSIAWGPWDGGMVDDGLRALFSTRGIALIPIDQGSAFLRQELSYDRQVQIVAGAANLGGSQRCTSEIAASPVTHTFLQDHMINGKCVLPVVLVLEWFHRFAAAIRPLQTVAAIQDFRVLKGVVLEPQDESLLCLKIVGDWESDHGNIDLTISSEDGLPRYAARAEMASNGISIEAEVVISDGEQSPWTLTPRKAYAEQLFHDPSFHVIDKLEGISGSGGQGWLRGTDAMAWDGGPWQTDPAALDGALQLALLWTIDQTGRTYLPTYIKSYRLHNSAEPGTLMKCQFETQLIDETKTDSSFILSDTDGRLLAELAGVEMYRIDNTEDQSIEAEPATIPGE